MAKIKLSEQPGKGFKKCIGAHIGRKGKRKPKVWWLGHYREPAERLVEVIQAEWQNVRNQGLDHWPADALERIEKARNGGVVIIPKLVESSRSRNFTTHQVLERYRTHFMAGERAISTKNTTHYQIQQLKKLVPDLAIRSMAGAEIQQCVDGVNASDLSGASKFNLVKLLRVILDWADRQEMWEAPRRFADFFVVKRKALSGIKTFNIGELGALWDAANDNQRLYLCLMLNCGFTAMDIARLEYQPARSLSLEPDDYKDGETLVFPGEMWKDKEAPEYERFDEWSIAGKRTKTNVFGAFPLWYPTAKLLAGRLRRGTAIVNGEGKALVAQKVEGARYDAVGQSLRGLIASVSGKGECRKLAVKALRKTGSQLVRDAAGLEISQLYLRHRPESVAERHYNRGNYERVAKALDDVWDTLNRLFPME